MTTMAVTSASLFQRDSFPQVAHHTNREEPAIERSHRRADEASAIFDREKVRETYNHIAKYARPDNCVAVKIVSTTLLLYFSLFISASFYDGVFSVWIRLILTILCGCTKTRIFIIMHDMAHHSFFSSKRANIVGATLLGVLVYTPYTGWKYGHDYHHRHSNNTDRKQWAQTAPLTVDQFRSLPWWGRWMYRFLYGRFTLCTTTPSIYFFVYQRFISKWYENLLIVGYWIFLLFGEAKISGVLQVHTSFFSYASDLSSGGELLRWRLVLTDVWATMIAAALGVFLFHIQHTFEGSYKQCFQMGRFETEGYSYQASGEEYSRFDNGMLGSSFLVVPTWLKYFTAGIEYHNVHHLNTRVPLYRLRQCFEDGGELFSGVPTFSLAQAFARLEFSLRDDANRAFVSCYSR